MDILRFKLNVRGEQIIYLYKTGKLCRWNSRYRFSFQPPYILHGRNHVSVSVGPQRSALAESDRLSFSGVSVVHSALAKYLYAASSEHSLTEVICVFLLFVGVVTVVIFM